jgi:DNA-binding transcriptional ArsR family regulator
MPLNHDTRRRIVSLLRNGEMTAGAIAEALGRARPGVSHHLSTLLEHGLIVCRQERAHRHYALDIAKTLRAWDVYVQSGGAG